MSDDRQKRKFARVPLVAQVQITIEGVEQLAGLLTDNISEGGVFVRTDAPLPIGRRIHVSVALRNCEALIEADGEVVWSRQTTDREPGGMGIFFHHVPQDGKKLIKDLVDQGHLKEQQEKEKKK